jgi:acetyl esterase
MSKKFRNFSLRLFPYSRRTALWLFFFLSLAGWMGCIIFRPRPWAATMLIREGFTKNAHKVNEALAKHVPEGIGMIADQQYSSNDRDAQLDVYFPQSAAASGEKLRVVVWTHGGAWVSGNKAQLSNYCRILAAKGFAVVSVNYSIAPEKRYPVPVRQLNAALRYLVDNAERFHIDTNALVLAGDSGGSHISAQTANCIVDSSYARLMGISPGISPSSLIGLVLYCGPYDAHHLNWEGEFGKFLKTVLWAYSGTRDFLNDPAFAPASVIGYVNKSFPPTYLSAGNKDPLAPQSQAMARKLLQHGVHVDTLFFPADYAPALPHEYQFNLDNEAGQLALSRSAAFVNALRKK